MRLPEDIRRALLPVLLSAIAATIAALAVEAWRPMSGPFWQYVAPHIPASTLLSLCSLLLVLVLLLSAWVAYLHFPNSPLDILRRYEPDSFSGAHRNKRTGLYYCTRCLFSDPPMQAPLYQPNGRTHWECPRCAFHYSKTPGGDAPK